MQPDSIDLTQAEDIANAVLAVDGVAGLHSGRYGEVALLFPGKRVRGLHVAHPDNENDSARFEVNIVADGTSLPNLENLASQVRDAVSQKVDMPVDVTISDVAYEK